MSPITDKDIARAISSREECSKIVSELLAIDGGHSNLVALVFALAREAYEYKSALETMQSSVYLSGK